MKFGDCTLVETFFKGVNQPIIVANDKYNLLLSDPICTINIHFKKLYEKLMLFLEPLLEPGIEGEISEITIKFNKKGNIIKIKMDEGRMVAGLLDEYLVKTMEWE